VNANSRPSFIVQTLSFMNCSCNFICGLSDVIIKTFSQSVSQSAINFYFLTYLLTCVRNSLLS